MLFHSLPDRFHLRNLVSPLLWLCGHPVGALGVALTTASFLVMVVFWWEAIFHDSPNPYVGIVGFIVLPTIFFLGLVLIPVGTVLRRRQQVRVGEADAKKLVFDWRDSAVRRTVLFVGLMTVLNVSIMVLATYRGTVYMGSVQFCGQTCHSVMNPEFIAYQRSPHARVECVTCHIGPGAPWFVRSKLSGSYQVLAVALNIYPRPIPTPIENLRPARETCEQCHWPEKFTGDKLLVKTQFQDDEENSKTKTVLLMHIGGRRSNGDFVGIHGAHLSPDHNGNGGRVVYRASDKKRQTIPWVGYRNDDGSLTEYVSSDYENVSPEFSEIEPRIMDCMDCHNRPTHVFRPVSEEIYTAMAAGLIDPALPYARRKAEEILTTEYAGRQEAAEQIVAAWQDYYREQYPEIFEAQRENVEHSAAALVEIYRQNVFPSMNITWGTYLDNRGHTYFPGCFRCHDESHTTADGRTITQDCFTCHSLLAMEEASPAILDELQIGE